MGSRAAPLAVAAVLLAGCGEEGKKAAPPPRLPHAVGLRLAARADGIGLLLRHGDGCGARRAATALRRDAIAAINAHRVPARLQEPLLGTVGDLAQRIVCVPPRPTPAPAPVGERKHEHGPKHKEHKPKEHEPKKHHDDGGDGE